jgi:hypothetical protein
MIEPAIEPEPLEEGANPVIVAVKAKQPPLLPYTDY